MGERPSIRRSRIGSRGVFKGGRGKSTQGDEIVLSPPEKEKVLYLMLSQGYVEVFGHGTPPAREEREQGREQIFASGGQMRSKEHQRPNLRKSTMLIDYEHEERGEKHLIRKKSK